MAYSKSEKTRDALIDAAGRLAAESGFDAISTRQIAELSGENIGSIHYHFGGKQQLFEAVVVRVVEPWLNNPLEDALGGCDLDNRDGQTEAITKLIRREIALLFDPQVPDWHCRIVHSLLQRQSDLQKTFREVFIIPEGEAILNLFQRIDPQIDRLKAIQYRVLIEAPLLLHIDYRPLILEQAGMTAYDENYINSLTETCIQQALNLFSLPERKNHE